MTGQGLAYLVGQIIGSLIFGPLVFGGLAWIIGLFAFRKRKWPERQYALVGTAYLIVAAGMIYGSDPMLAVVMLPSALVTALLARRLRRPKPRTLGEVFE